MKGSTTTETGPTPRNMLEDARELMIDSVYLNAKTNAGAKMTINAIMVYLDTLKLCLATPKD